MYLPVVAVALLAIGAAVATGVSGALGLSFTPNTAPAEHPRAVDAGPMVAPPAVATIVVPDDKRVTLAADAVAAALVARGRPRPAITTAAPPLPPAEFSG